ncbi:UNVERIFIED_CONTAM: hypothetical protein GTU68_023192 [Idotea baltica]|nr:hypothetical protein [Idotea baltica]
MKKVSLIGAGPGAVDLITLRGIKALQTADVVLYDALANTEFLQFVPKDAVKIYVGKRANNHHYTQDEINYLLVFHAMNTGHVVRLKGGDPFVFGRGHEEMEYLQAFDIEVNVVPGISSCISLPELQQVPVTRRGVSESFWVLTATTTAGKLSADVELAAQSSATVVLLMGIRKLGIIVELFEQHGKANTPVMIIQNGSRIDEKVVVGNINDIEYLAKQNNIGSPGIIVIGDVVALHKNYAYEEAIASVSNRSI